MTTLKQGLQQLAHLGLRVYLKIRCGMRVHGVPRLGQPSILVANHASHIDIAAVFAALPISEVSKVRTAAARDTIYALPAPVVALVEFLFNTYPFERKGSSSDSLERGADCLRRGYHLAIFPEGRRSQDGRFLGFTPGFAKIAYQTGAPVVPIQIQGTYRTLPRGTRYIQRQPMVITFFDPIEADRSISYEARRDAYAKLVADAESAFHSSAILE
ncbi:MAG TPA: lysophospholipid acyltransferase family protein [Planctomycetota bacterium]|nr:lysophospholipid acyltransferase family protein [Planctomycetota bacterium]